MAQVKASPALIAANTSPCGGVDSPEASLPQQVAAPLASSAQVCVTPPLIAVNALGVCAFAALMFISPTSSAANATAATISKANATGFTSDLRSVG